MNIHEYGPCPKCGDPMWCHNEHAQDAHDETDKGPVHRFNCTEEKP